MRSGKIALSIVAFAFLLLMGQTGWAQTKPATEKVVIGGKKYMLYTVAKGDTPPPLWGAGLRKVACHLGGGGSGPPPPG